MSSNQQDQCIYNISLCVLTKYWYGSYYNLRVLASSNAYFIGDENSWNNNETKPESPEVYNNKAGEVMLKVHMKSMAGWIIIKKIMIGL